MKSVKCLLVASVVLLLASCTKFENGPNFSFRSVKQRITNTYNVESYSVNGVQKASLPEYSTMRQFWQGDGVYTSTFINPTNGVGERVDGTWSLEDDNTKILLKTVNKLTGQVQESIVYNIIKLTNKQMWLRSVDNSIEMHLVRDNSN